MGRLTRRGLLAAGVLALTGCGAPAPTGTQNPTTAATGDTKPPPPAATTAPAPTAKPQPLPLRIVDKGYGQRDTVAAYAVVIENPNPALSVEFSSMQVAFYDAASTVLTAQPNTASLLLPGQTLGYVSLVPIPAGAKPTRLDVQLKPGTFKVVEPTPTFTVENVTMRTQFGYPFVTAVVKSPYKQDAKLVHVTAVARDSGGAIIGGGFTFLQFVPAEGQAALDIQMTTAGEPAKVDMYASVGGVSSFG